MNVPTIAKSSTLRNQLDAAPSDDVSDPLKALEAIVGKALSDLRSNFQDEIQHGNVDRPSQLIENIDFGGLSLNDFVDNDPIAQNHRVVSTYVGQSVDECMCFNPYGRLYSPLMLPQTTRRKTSFEPFTSPLPCVERLGTCVRIKLILLGL